MSKTTKLYAITILLCIIGILITLNNADAIDGNETLQQIKDAERRGKGVC